LLKAALRLPARERAAFAGSLLRSLEAGEDPGAESAWAAEIARRVKELDEGKVKLIPWSVVRRRLYRKLASLRDGRR
jgi:putative addiction module component (TIGR02574 family)